MFSELLICNIDHRSALWIEQSSVIRNCLSPWQTVVFGIETLAGHIDKYIIRMSIVFPLHDTDKIWFVIHLYETKLKSLRSTNTVSADWSMRIVFQTGRWPRTKEHKNDPMFVSKMSTEVTCNHRTWTARCVWAVCGDRLRNISLWNLEQRRGLNREEGVKLTIA